MNCPKCGYQRTRKDDVETPEYQCPSCGIIYAKYLRHKAGFLPQKSAKTAAKKRRPQLTALIATHYSRIVDRINWRAIIGKIKIGPIDKRKRIIAAGLSGLLVLLIWSYVSPALFFNTLRKTAIEKDASDLVGYIDFDKLRINIKYSLQEILSETEKTHSDPRYQAGRSLGAMMANNMVDSMISPAGVKAMLTPKNKSAELPDFKFHYVDINKAKIIVGNAAISLDRTGPFSWIMVGIGTIE
jgi:transcription initiation factor TFIIIB Brf1 subunit/transcription initiation factor TFIIB